MKERLKILVYVIALVIIMIPIALEQAGNPMTALMQTITLIIGLAVLFFGKLYFINEKKKRGGRPGSHDTLILALILFMAGYTLYNYFV